MQNKIVYLLCCCIFLFSCKEASVANYASGKVFQLAPPKILVDSLLFATTAQLEAEFDMPDAVIRYTTGGYEVTASSKLYTKPITVKEASKFTFATFHSEYQKSPEVQIWLTQIKQNVSDTKVTLSPEPHPNYPGDGAQVLVDLQKGTTQFRAGKQWLGFQSKQVIVQLDFEKEISIEKLLISSLNDHGSWIFVPQAIHVSSNDKEIGFLTLKVPAEVEPKQIKLLDVPVINGTYKTITIQIDLMEAIPEWHQGKGTAPFFFIDEILVE